MHVDVPLARSLDYRSCRESKDVERDADDDDADEDEEEEHNNYAVVTSLTTPRGGRDGRGRSAAATMTPRGG